MMGTGIRVGAHGVRPFVKGGQRQQGVRRTPLRQARRGNSSVTLAELLVASVILSICLLGVHQAGRSVLTAARETERNAERIEDLREAFKLMARDLRSAVIVKDQPDTRFAGGVTEEGASMSFTTLSGESTLWRSGWKPALLSVTYSMKDGDLSRAASSAVQPDEAPPVVLASGLDRAEFRFYEGDSARESWESEKELPRAVEVALAFKGTACRTLICIPAGGKTEEGQ
jgi:type II secretion system protein J